MRLSTKVIAVIIVAGAMLGCSLLAVPWLVQENRARTGHHELDYRIMIRSAVPLENLTLIVPAPSVNGGKDAVPDLVQGSWSGIPTGSQVALVREGWVVMTRVTVPRFVPERHEVPVSIPEEYGAYCPAGNGHYTAAGCDGLPPGATRVSPGTSGTSGFAGTPSLDMVTFPVELGTRREVERTIATRDPHGHEPLLYGGQGLVPVECSHPGTVTTRCYAYESRLFVDHGSPGPVSLDIVVTEEGRNEWWELGWSGNSYTDHVSIHLEDDRKGWIAATGVLRTGDGRY